jgi:hypothetical protein
MVSGYGEATLWPELRETVVAWAPQFPCVQLISNGAGPRYVFDRFCELPNFQACITLDGHTAELDRFRTKGNESMHRRVVRTVDRLVATPSQLDAVEGTLVDRHAEFSPVLPPLSYTSRMVGFMRESHRRTPCHVHRANFGVNTQLQALACACAGDRLIAPLGPVSAVGVDPNVERRQLQYLRDDNVGAKCSTCFTHYDVINLYLDGSMSDDEVARVPSLSSPEALAHLRAVKADMAGVPTDGAGRL